jgi:coatomer protein complex subunit alpha (xenin)
MRILDPLAYLTAKTHGLTEEAESILEASGLTEDQISLPALGEPSKPPRVIVPTYKSNWPVKSAAHSSFEKALLGEVGGEEAIENGYDMIGEEERVRAGDELAVEAEDEEATGWDMGEDIAIEEESSLADVEGVQAGPTSSEAELWARNSSLAADHVAAGSFDTAMQLLNRQVAVVNFEPLKPRFMEIYQSSKTYLPATAGLEPLVNYVRRTVDETDSRKLLPIIPRSLESIASADLQEGYAAMRSNRLEEGVNIFRRILHSVLVNTVSSESHVAEAKKIISTAREYILAMTIELERRNVGTDTPEKLKRNLELGAYFTVPKLEVAHRQLALFAAMQQAFTNKNYASALRFANRMIANGTSPKFLDKVGASYSGLRPFLLSFHF